MRAMSASIEQLRLAIDDVDHRILMLLAERLRLVLQVGTVKRELSKRVYDPDRERALLQRVSQAAPDPLDGAMVERIFEVMVRECRRREQLGVAEPPEPSGA